MIRTLLALAAAMLLSCNAPPTEAQYDLTRGGRLDVYYNDPGTRRTNMWEPDAEQILVDLIDGSNASIDFAVMGFTRQPVISALIRAHDRGVKVRMVGDADHWYNTGYRQLDARQIPIVTGNQPHIMHNKFFIFDRRIVMAQTSNVSDSDMRMNSNNFIVMDSPPIAADFQAEFEQMFGGLFGHTKSEIDNGRVYEVGDTTVEVWFTPNEDALGRILEIVDGAEESVRFTIFAFTKDQIGSAYIRKQRQFMEWNEANGVDTTGYIDTFRTVAGVVDQSQLHSNGQYHEAYRLLGAQVPIRLDANDNTMQPGDYQAGGGRLHSKTMLIDADGENPIVITGSFNWSAAATSSNDEFLLILRGERVAQMYKAYFAQLWGSSRRMGKTFVGEQVEEGDVVINEVMWYGLNSGDDEGLDEFIELRNMTDRDLDLSMWQIVNDNDIVVGLVPGSVIPAGGTFLILDHTLEPYRDGVPQDQNSAFLGGDLVVNTFNDNRQARLYLKDGSMLLKLQDPDGFEVDRAGDGGPAFAGGPFSGGVIRSMERRSVPGDGGLPGSWYSSTVSAGTGVTNPDYADEVRATPGAANSPAP